ncbi:hypothetical protein Tco_1034193 [Tanacetum coccineum]
MLHQPLGYGNGFLQSLSSRAILIGQEPFQFGPGDPVGLFYPNRLGVCIPPGQGVIVDLTGDEDPTDKDGDTRMGDSTGVSVSLGGEISSGGKKSQE